LQKYYAVRRGKKPGIYLTWPECKAQVDGFAGARYKSFTDRAQAEAFLDGKDSYSKPAKKQLLNQKFPILMILMSLFILMVALEIMVILRRSC
jgi:Predicted double-stranded RNA/RNA-DNA hybrid binding protein